MGFYKTFKNKKTFEFWIRFEPKTAIYLYAYYSKYGHKGFYFYLNIFGLSLDISFYGPEE